MTHHPAVRLARLESAVKRMLHAACSSDADPEGIPLEDAFPTRYLSEWTQAVADALEVLDEGDEA